MTIRSLVLLLIRFGCPALLAGPAAAQGPDSASAAGQDTTTENGFPTFAGPMRAPHPGYRMIDLAPEGFAFRVTGLDFLPGGDLALATISDTVSPEMGGGFGDVYRLKGARAASSNRLACEKIYTGFQVPLGLATAGDSVFVSDLNGLQRLVDADGDGRADSLETVFPYPIQSSVRWQLWSMSVLHSGDRFYTALGAYHYVDSLYDAGTCLPKPTRGTIHVADRSGKAEYWGSGLREPNGLGFGPDGELFATDNDGEWVPANKLVHIRKDAFYGVCVGTAWDPSLAYARPAVWFPELLRSPGQPVLLGSGPYRGQMIVGDYEILNLSRIFLEKVGGEYQGALFPFTGGLITGAIRLATDPEGDLYLGEMEVNTSESWWYHGDPRNRPTHVGYGLQKMLPVPDTAFEMRAVRALPGGFAIDFTLPAGPSAACLTHYQVRQWRYQPTFHYGGPRLDLETLPVAAAALSPDGKTVTLDIPGLKADRVVYIQLHRDLRARDGRAPWSYEAWYTLNAIPGRQDAIRPGPAADGPPAFSIARGAGGGEIRVFLEEPFSWEIRDLRGERVRSGAGEGPQAIPLSAVPGPGMHVFRLRTRHRAYRGLIPP